MPLGIRKILALLLILTGLSMALYPWISNFCYVRRIESEVAAYQKENDSVNAEENLIMLEEARQYNENLSKVRVRMTDPFGSEREEQEAYQKILPEVMCFLEIPVIDVYLPVYHGVSEEVLQKGIGHVEGSSLPIGGRGCHAVLSGHTGMNSARMFTDLTGMEENDIFYIHILGQTLVYQVRQIQVIEPEDTQALQIDPQKDLVTLLTCTPYGVNSHRLLVTGERLEDEETIKNAVEAEQRQTDSQWMASYRTAAVTGLGLIFLAGLGDLLIRKKGRKRRR